MEGKDNRKPRATLDTAGWSLKHSASSIGPTLLTLSQCGPQASIQAPILQIGKLIQENAWALTVPSANAQTEQCLKLEGLEHLPAQHFFPFKLTKIEVL